MSLQIIHSKGMNVAAFYNTTSNWAFGPVAEGEDAEIQLIVFQEWLELRPEQYEADHLEREWGKFTNEYMPGFKEWCADIWDEITWRTVRTAMDGYRQAQEDAHEGYKFEGPVGP